MDLEKINREIKASEFEPAVKTVGVQKLTRPSLSYWEDAWIRLKKNRPAIASLGLICFLLAFSILGPWVWPVDPTKQNLGRISEPPSLGKVAVVIEKKPEDEIRDENFPAKPNADNANIQAPQSLQVVGIPTTLAVQIRWSPVEGAASYEIYRSEEKPEDSASLGLPLREVLGGNVVSFIDQLKLKDQVYYYSVVPKSLVTKSSQFQTLRVEVRLGILLSDALSQYPNVQAGQQIKLPSHPLGTDYLGRDMLARLMAGGRVSLFIGIVAPLLFIFLGTLIGGVAGYLGGKVDAVIMRTADIISSLPFLLVMIILYVVFVGNDNSRSVAAILMAMVFLFWPGTARLVRGQILQIREEGYVQAAKLLGVKTSYLILRHMIPNTLGVVLVTLTFAVPSSIFTEAFLSFVGMGVRPPDASWGSLCEEGVRTMLTSPHELFWPATFISLTTLAFNLLGDGLRDALDARMRSRE